MIGVGMLLVMIGDVGAEVVCVDCGTIVPQAVNIMMSSVVNRENLKPLLKFLQIVSILTSNSYVLFIFLLGLMRSLLLVLLASQARLNPRVFGARNVC